MKFVHFFIPIILILFAACNTMQQSGSLAYDSVGMVESTPMINDYGKTILERFDPPKGYTRVPLQSGSFGEYLRTLTLKPEGAPARMYDGKIKPNHNIYVSVVDMPISPRDLQSSADAVIRLKSEYLFAKKDYDKIAFHANKEKFSFTEFSGGDTSKTRFQEYLDYVMEKVSTPSFCDDLVPIKLWDIQVGDIFIQKNNPNGHAVVVVDLVKNSEGEKLFLLAQSYQPAQEIQIISNPSRDDISPWYEAKEGQMLTPEWRFLTSDLMRFKDLKE